MNDQQATVAVYTNHERSEQATGELQKAGNFVVIAHGTTDELAHAKEILSAKPATNTVGHL